MSEPEIHPDIAQFSVFLQVDDSQERFCDFVGSVPRKGEEVYLRDEDSIHYTWKGVRFWVVKEVSWSLQRRRTSPLGPSISRAEVVLVPREEA